jgi:hypothetical protein
MTRFSWIDKIVICRLPPTKEDGYRQDRSGVILKVYPEGELTDFLARRITEVLQSAILLLGYSPEHVRRGEMGEQMECWINREVRERFIYVNHKYWNQKQIDCFIGIILAMAKLHDWKWEVE